jgi:F0F1-type ATP synthase membrane subunit c/vacuolar-type H+-ATPase subunit K
MPNIKSILKIGFPFISAGLSAAGPLGAMAGNALGAVLGVSKSNPSSDELESAFSKIPPDQLSGVIERMKQAEQQFQLDAQKLGYEHAEQIEKLGEQDRENARNREILVRDKVPAILAIGVTLGFFGLLGAMLWFSPPASNKDLLNIMLGSLGTAWIAIIGYYFGSSKGSDDKNQIISNLSK